MGAVKVKKLILVLVISFLLVGCSNINQQDKTNCQNSGGEYKKSLSETAGPSYYCKCPLSKYESNKVCVDIMDKEIAMCNVLSNEFVDCNNNKGACECIFKQTKATYYFSYATLIYAANCNIEGCGCSCKDDSCGCFLGSVVVK